MNKFRILIHKYNSNKMRYKYEKEIFNGMPDAYYVFNNFY